MSVPLSQALGGQIFFGSNGYSRNVSRCNSGTTAPLAFQTVDLRRPCIGNLRFPELASQSACRPPPTSRATGWQRQAPANPRAIPSSKIICYASLTTQSRGTAIVPMSVPLFPALGASIYLQNGFRQSATSPPCPASVLSSLACQFASYPAHHGQGQYWPHRLAS